MSTFNPFKVNSNSSISQNNTNTFFSVQNKSSSLNNNPFLPKNEKSFSNNFNSNPFNSISNNKNFSQNNTNPFLSSNKFPFPNNTYNNNTNNNNNVGNPFLNTNNNNNIGNIFSNNINNNNSIFNNSNNNFLNNNLNNSQSINPFNLVLNNNNPFLSNNSNNNNIINNSGNNSIFNNNQNNNIFGMTKNSNNNSSFSNNISFGFNNNNNTYNYNNIFMNNNNNSQNNINNNNFFSNSKQFSHLFNNENNKNISLIQNNKNINNNEIKAKDKKEEKEDSKKIIPLSKILSLRFQSEDFLEEILNKINEDKDSIKILTKSLNLSNYNDLIIDTILSSKSKKEENKEREKEQHLNLLKIKNNEIKRRRERIVNEKRYENNLKELYKKNEKNDIKRIIKLNSQKTNINNSEQKEKKRYSLINENNNKEGKEEIKDNKKNITYKIFIKVYNYDKNKVLEKTINIDKNLHYILDLDKLYNDIISTLDVLKINCRFGLDYKINNFEIKKNIRKINLLEYEVLGYIQTKNIYYKELEMEINIINENISEEEALLNPQLHCKNDKNYILNPSLEIINNTNLFKYNKGLEIILGNISIIFTNKKEYDLTNINFGELCYDGGIEIYFDEINFKKEKSSFRKLWDKQVCLIYNIIEEKNSNIILNYLNKRYSAEFIDIKDNKITLITKLKYLFLREKGNKNFFLNK